MTEDRIHRAVSEDGTEIVGAVHGEGPPLVLIHGAMDDGDVSWRAALPVLARRFTCHVPSLRNRGRSGASEDSSPERLVQDVTAYASSLEQPIGLAGLSLGGGLVLGAAAQLDNVRAVAAYEPVLMEAMSEEDRARFAATVMREAEEAKQGRLNAAVRIFAELVGNEHEVATLDARGAFEAMGRNVPADLAAIQQGAQYSGPRPTDPSVLAQLTAPLLLLQGQRSRFASWFHAGVRHVAELVSHASVHVFDDLGHLALMVEGEPVAEQISHFFEHHLKTASTHGEVASR